MISGRSKVGAVRRLCEGLSRSSGFRIFSGPMDRDFRVSPRIFYPIA